MTNAAEAARMIPENELDNAIRSMEMEMELLQYDRKSLNKKVIANRQRQAEVRNVLRELKERKKGVK